MTTWTAERDQRLLLLYIDLVRPDFAAVAEAWDRLYVKTGIDNFKPTKIALSKHVDALKIRAGLKPKPGAAAVGQGAAKTKKSTTTSAPSQRKRKRTPQKGDDNESVDTPAIEQSEEDAMSTGAESDADASETPLGPRNTPSRTAKTAVKTEYDGAADSSGDESSDSKISSYSAAQ